MPNNDFTTKLLELEDVNINDVQSTNTEIHIHFTMNRRTHKCPKCGNLTDKVHDYRVSIIKDIPFMGKKAFMHYKKRRYCCTSCKKRFYENCPIVRKHCRITTRLVYYAIDLLRERQSVSSSASLVGISCSSLFRFISYVNYSKPDILPQVLSIDEFKGNAGGEKFQAILTDAKNHKLVDILPSRTQATLVDYIHSFKNRNDVRYFVMDMNTVYRDIARNYFPNATIVIDKFHVVRYVTWAVENVRKRIQKKLHPDKRKYFKRSRRLLLTHRHKLKPDSLDALEIILMHSNDLAVAYYLKELFYDFMNSKSRDEATPKLRKFILAAQASELDEFKACLTMLGNWSKYILNAFDCPYSNGYTEGTNNAIKVIKRNAFGYRNFMNFRNRIFLSLT